LSPRSSPRIAGTPEEKEESSDDAVILERLSKGLVSNHFLFDQVLLTSSPLSPATQGLLVTTSIPNMESVSSEESLLSTCFLVFAVHDLLVRPPMRVALENKCRCSLHSDPQFGGTTACNSDTAP
jgi:hypothetical protein